MDDLAESFLRVLWLWKAEAIITIAIIVGVMALHRLGRLWHIDVSLTSVLGAGLIGALLPLYFRWNIGLSPRALFCILLYAWCVAGMLFLAARQTHVIKLLIGLASQAGVVYALFRLI